jgi:acyl-CoA ligase (AMP-forming) (exosortase A-associated)
VQELSAKPMPLDHLCLRGAADDVALETRAEAIRYSELGTMVGRIALFLKDKGLKRGDRVASWLNKTAEACLLPLACARAGLVHVPVNPALKRGQVAHILEDSGALVLIAGAGRLDALEPQDVPKACALIDEAIITSARMDGDGLPQSDHDPNDLVAILYTSGSTGRPKGVMLSHANLWLGAISVSHYLGLGRDDKTLCVLPLSFDYGQNQLLSSWAVGACAVPFDYLMSKEVVKAVERHGITTLAGVPPLWVQLVEADWGDDVCKQLHRITNSGGALTSSLITKLRALFPETALYPMYGLTEAFRSTYLDPALIDARPGSIGKAIPFAEIMVVRPDSGDAGPDEPGELVHAGPLVAQGYWQDAERTALRFKPAPSWSSYGGMAVWSGDTVRRDADGFLYFVGRDDEMIKTSGNRVSPTEIEEIAITSGQVTEAVAFGVPDEKLGQAIILIVRGTENEALARHLKAELPAFLQPKQTVWLADLPRNPNGKLDRTTIKSDFLSARNLT